MPCILERGDRGPAAAAATPAVVAVDKANKDAGGSNWCNGGGSCSVATAVDAAIGAMSGEVLCGGCWAGDEEDSSGSRRDAISIWNGQCLAELCLGGALQRLLKLGRRQGISIVS